jgi:heme A synthase
VRGLIERGIIPHSPGWTVTELAAAATRVRPALTAPLGGAAMVFSEIWYGLRPAHADDDQAMRAYAEAISTIVADASAAAAAAAAADAGSGAPVTAGPRGDR